MLGAIVLHATLSFFYEKHINMFIQAYFGCIFILI